MNWGQRAGSGQISKTEPRSADGEDARGERRKADSSPEALRRGRGALVTDLIPCRSLPYLSRRGPEPELPLLSRHNEADIPR